MRQQPASEPAREWPGGWQRFWVLGLFAWLGTQQCYCWYTFGSLPGQTAAYFGQSAHWGDSFSDLSMDYGAIVFVAVVPLCAWSLRQPGGLPRAMRCSACLTALGCLLRFVPCFVAPRSRRRRAQMVWLLHLGSILNAAVGALYQSAASQLSAGWFGPEQRTTATAVAYSGGNLGMVLGYAAGYGFGAEGGLPALLLTQLLISLVPLVAVLSHCPGPPSQTSGPAGSAGSELRQLIKDAGRLVSDRSVLLLLLAGGAEAGANAAWGGLLPQIFATRYSQSAELANLCGLVNCAGSLGGMLLSGRLADRCFRGRLLQMMLWLFGLSTAVNCLISLMFGGPWGGPVLELGRGWLMLVMGLAGMLQGMLDPLFLELAAELSWPVPEGTSAGLLTLLYNLAALAVLTLSPFISAKAINMIYTGVFACCFVMLLGVKQRYKRSEAELLAAESRLLHEPTLIDAK